MESPDPDPDSQVAAAAAQLEVARRSGRVGAIALAQLNLAATLAALGDHEAAVDQFGEVISYAELAGRDDERELQRQLRRISLSAPPPDADDADLRTVATLAAILMAESQVALGRRAEARDTLDRAAPGTRGFGRGSLRKRLAAARRRLDAPLAEPSTAATTAAARTATSPVEQVAAADELLSLERPAEAARHALAAIQACDPADVLTRARARQVLGMALDAMGRSADATPVLTEAHADYLSAEDPAGAASLAVALAWRAVAAGDPATAIPVLERTLRAGAQTLAPDSRARLLIDLGSIQDSIGSRSDARATLHTALTVAQQSGDVLTIADARHGLAVLLATSSTERAPLPDDAVEALTLLDECRRDYEQVGARDRAVGCDHEAAALLGRLGSFDAAAARYRRALSGYQSLPPSDRDTGSWPDEVSDCEANLAALGAGSEAESAGTPDPARIAADATLFRSGGHAMAHGAPAAPA